VPTELYLVNVSAVCIALLLSAATSPLAAQELSALAGAADTNDHTASYGWQIGISQAFGPHFSGELAWVNEGHLLEHHRDGLAGQLWLQSPPWHALRFAVGFGPYMYFDTEPNSDAAGFSDNHGIGIISSAAVILEPPGRWIYRLNFNEIHAIGDIETRSVMLGAGYRFDSIRGDGDGEQEHHADAWLGPEAQVFGGESIRNSIGLNETRLFGIDAQSSAFLQRFSGAATWMHLLRADLAPSNRLAAQLRVEEPLDASRLAFEFGLGGYVSVGGYSGVDSSASRVRGLLLLRGSWSLTQHMAVVANWFRTFTADDRDRDMITLGLAWRFGQERSEQLHESDSL